jgi:sirohydrochlorin ferrochelatase
MRPIVLMVGHGSRDASGNQEFEQFVERYQARRPELELRHGYIELAQPSLADALANLPAETDEATLLPVFLFAAGRQLGVHERLLGVLDERLDEVRQERAPRAYDSSQDRVALRGRAESVASPPP